MNELFSVTQRSEEKKRRVELLNESGLKTDLQAYPELTGRHEACRILPFATDQEFQELAVDIEGLGLIEPIVVTPDGLVVDGKMRLLACFVTGAPPHFKVTDSDPWTVSFSANLCRQSLTPGQLQQFSKDSLAYAEKRVQDRQQRGAA